LAKIFWAESEVLPAWHQSVKCLRHETSHAAARRSLSTRDKITRGVLPIWIGTIPRYVWGKVIAQSDQNGFGFCFQGIQISGVLVHDLIAVLGAESVANTVRAQETIYLAGVENVLFWT
jgi:hypothetical protein